MSGPFYGSLAASASVFVAILTALLVNDYVRIRADRRQITHRLERIQGELEGLQNRQEEHESTVESIRSEWEQEYREEAEETVDIFISEHIGSEFAKPIENLTLDTVYEELIDFSDAESGEELEGGARNPHHKEILEERWEEIEDKILPVVTHNFAKRYEGEGWEPDEEIMQSSEEDEDEDVPELVEKLREETRDPMTFDDFLESYRDTYEIESLKQKTRDQLRQEYDEVVDRNPAPLTQSTSSDLLGMSSALSGLEPILSETEPYPAIPSTPIDPTAAQIKNVEEQRTYNEARDKLMQVNSQIQALKREKEALEGQKQRLHPEDLKDALFANVLTVIFSVVVPMAAYLFTISGLSIIVPNWATNIDLFSVFVCWLLGLVVAFDWIYAEINDADPRSRRLYVRLREFN